MRDSTQLIVDASLLDRWPNDGDLDQQQKELISQFADIVTEPNGDIYSPLVYLKFIAKLYGIVQLHVGGLNKVIHEDTIRLLNEEVHDFLTEVQLKQLDRLQEQAASLHHRLELQTTHELVDEE